MDSHPRVKHPAELVEHDVSRFNDWVTNHLALALGSMTGVYLALVLPLIAIGVPIVFKFTVIIFSSWIQSFGLFSLQRTANRADSKRAAKSDVDHEALTHIAQTVDDIRNYQRGDNNGEQLPQ